MEIADFFLLLAFMFNCLSTLIETQNVKFIILLKVILNMEEMNAFLIFL